MLQILLLIISIEIIKLEYVGHYQKRVRTRLRNLKKKEKGPGGRCRLTDATIDRLQNYEGVASYSSKCWEPAKYEINFLVSLFRVVSNQDGIYHYPHCPIDSDSWCKYNAGRTNLQTPKLLNLGQVFQKTLIK